jgi:hypothetical protein
MQHLVRVCAIGALSVLSACRTADTLPRVAPQPSPILLEQDLVGCYKLASLDWAPHPGPVNPPKLFLLTAKSTWDSRFLIESIEPKNVRLSATWRVVDVTTMEAAWSDMFVGVRLILHRQAKGEGLTGLAVPFSDAGTPAERGRVVIERVACL